MRDTILLITACLLASALHELRAQSPAAEALEKLKALQGDWIDVEGVFGDKGKVAVTYRVTGAGHTVVETFPVGTPYEMTTVYHLDGNRLVLTHYCTSNTQPKMATDGLKGNLLVFDYSGGTNIEPATTSHMHGASIEFVSADEIKSTWLNWKDGKAAHSATFRIVRKK